MASAAKLFAQTFDWVKWSAKNSNRPIGNLKATFVECDIRSRDRSFICMHMALVPVIIEEIEKVKTRTSVHEDFVSLLGDHGPLIWKSTLDDLREMESKEDIPEFHMIPSAILGWSKLGALAGVHKLVDSVIGCCHSGCPNFLVVADQKFSRCAGCKKVTYCTQKCQTSDWKVHRPHCTPKKQTNRQ
ncbi:hypothetical protein CPB83DRAFT_856740 [Crepidotus variabilis]|uniref:MYND-type domain-containing protein n=1 Tax=Crepidotus variabilis TaxID=179855 RepID=A0A9P6EDS3_9AGAR|nr:hypothetical protein CPB83DRAFT_856740 [Crepidotus variabilis]